MFATRFGVYAMPGPTFAQMLTFGLPFGMKLDEFWDHFGDLGDLWESLGAHFADHAGHMGKMSKFVTTLGATWTGLGAPRSGRAWLEHSK